MRQFRKSVAWISAIVLNAVFLSACASIPRDSFTADDVNRATVSGFHSVRFWGDDKKSPNKNPYDALALARSQNVINYLAISAGGSGGAFGAGLLNGWSKAGTRPKFDIVSGVSTGALIAPFAFLGAEYDDRLREAYLQQTSSSLVTPRSIIQIASESGIAKSEPLRALIEKYADDEMLRRIAVEHSRGRRLYVVTTNLDAQRPQIWNMGAIASSEQPDALKLFQDVLVASASIPVIYPPVFIRASIDGKEFSEMHVDGGTTGALFTFPDRLLASDGKARGASRVNVYVIVNNTLDPEFALIENGNVAVAQRSFSTLIKSQTKGNLLSAFATAKRLGYNFNVADIQQSTPYDEKNPFDLDYMSAVYQFGYQGALNGTVWRLKP